MQKDALPASDHLRGDETPPSLEELRRELEELNGEGESVVVEPLDERDSSR